MTVISFPWEPALAALTIFGMAWRLGVVVVKHLKKISEQMAPNGGSSLRDAINRIERGVQFGERRSRILYDVADMKRGWFETNAAGQCTHVSNSWCQMHHFQRDEALDNGWLNVVKDADRKRFMDAWTFAIHDSRSFDTYYGAITGSAFHLHAEKVIGAGEELLGFIGYVEEVGRQGDTN